jgi:hypothetical protein
VRACTNPPPRGPCPCVTPRARGRSLQLAEIRMRRGHARPDKGGGVQGRARQRKRAGPRGASSAACPRAPRPRARSSPPTGVPPRGSARAGCHEGAGAAASSARAHASSKRARRAARRLVPSRPGSPYPGCAGAPMGLGFCFSLPWPRALSLPSLAASQRASSDA